MYSYCPIYVIRNEALKGQRDISVPKIHLFCPFFVQSHCVHTMPDEDSRIALSLYLLSTNLLTILFLPRLLSFLFLFFTIYSPLYSF